MPSRFDTTQAEDTRKKLLELGYGGEDPEDEPEDEENPPERDGGD